MSHTVNGQKFDSLADAQDAAEHDEERAKATRPSGPSGRSKTHAERQATGLRLVQVYLSPEAATALDSLVARLGSNRAAVEWALVEAPTPPRLTVATGGHHGEI